LPHRKGTKDTIATSINGGWAVNTVTLLIVMFVLVLVLGLQIQMTQTNKKLDAFLKRMENFMGDAMKYVNAKNHLN
jgi:hypothetical protein